MTSVKLVSSTLLLPSSSTEMVVRSCPRKAEQVKERQWPEKRSGRDEGTKLSGTEWEVMGFFLAQERPLKSKGSLGGGQPGKESGRLHTDHLRCSKRLCASRMKHC